MERMPDQPGYPHEKSNKKIGSRGNTGVYFENANDSRQSNTSKDEPDCTAYKPNR